MIDSADLAFADQDPAMPADLTGLITRIVADPASGPYDEYVARSYGRAVTTGRVALADSPDTYADDGLIAQPLVEAAAAQLGSAQQQDVFDLVSAATFRYFEDAQLGRRIVDAPGPEILKHRPPDPAVLMYRGEFIHSTVDIRLPGSGIDFVFRRQYGNQTAYEGPLGAHWNHNYNILLTEIDPTRLVMTTGALGEETYTLHPIYLYYVPPAGIDAVFEAMNDTFFRRAPDGTRHIFRRVPGTRYHDLDRIEDRFGNYISFEYSNNEKRSLERVEVNHPKRFVTFVPDELGRICIITDFAGRTWRYCYDDLNDLVAVTSPATDRYPPGLTTCFEYRSSSVTGALQHNLTRIIDASGRLYLENDYGESPGTLEYNRVVRQRQGGGESYLDYEAVAPISEGPYTEAELPTLQVTHTRRNGHRALHAYNSHGNLVYTEECVKLDGRPRVLQTRYRYNRDGRLVGMQTPEGALTQYLYARDWFVHQQSITDDEVDSHPNLTREERQSFGKVLALVRRGKVHRPSQPTATRGPWSAFPSIIDTRPDSADIIIKMTYEPTYGLIETISHPEYTTAALPNAINEHPRHSETLTRYEYTGPLRLLRRIRQPVPTDADGNPGPQAITEFTVYDANGRLRQMIDAENTMIRFEYFAPATGADATKEGFLRSVEFDPAGLAIKATYDVDQLGRVVAVHRPEATGDGRFVEYTRYNELDQVIETIGSAPFAYSTRSFYDKTGNLEQRERDLRDEDGNVLHGGTEVATFCYDEEFNLRRETLGGLDLAGHHVTTHCYGPSGELAQTTLPAGNRIRYRYDGRLQLVEVTEGVGSTDASTRPTYYDDDGRIIGTGDGRGNRTTYELDTFGRAVSIENAIGHTTRINYDKMGNTTIVRVFEWRPTGYYLLARSEFVYDEVNRATQTARDLFTTPPGPFTRTDLPSAGLSSPGPGRVVRSRTFYDGVGRVSRVVDSPDDRTTLIDYDTVGCVTKLTDPLGNETHMQHDAHGNVTRIDEVDIVRHPVTGAEVGRQVFPATSEYDELGRLKSTTDGLGNTYRFRYDSLGNTTRVIDPLQNEIRSTYNVYGRVATRASFLTPTGLGPVDHLAAPVATAYEYDQNDNLLRVSDARGNATRYIYDALDRRRVVIYPDGTEAITDYDADGNIIRTVDANGTQRRYTIDATGQTTHVNVDKSQLIAGVEIVGATWEYYEYDARGRVARDENDYATNTTQYDSLDRPIESTLMLSDGLAGGQGPFTISRTYDDAGALQELVYPGGRRLVYRRDDLGRVTAVRNEARGANYPGDITAGLPDVLVRFDYAGRLLSRAQHGNGATTEYRYDSARRIVEIAHSAAGQQLATLQYLYDGVGNLRVRQDDGIIRRGRQKFAYDSMYRLVNQISITVGTFNPAAFTPASQPGQPIGHLQGAMDTQVGNLQSPPPPMTFDYDLAGNRSQFTGDLDLTYVTNSLDQVTAIMDIGTGITDNLSYDPAGNLIYNADHQYTYDTRNRLTRIRSAGGIPTHEFFHDATGRRVAENTPSGTTILIPDRIYTIAEIKDGTLVAQYAFGDEIDHPVQIVTSGSDYSYHSDLIGSIRALTGTGGSQSAHYEYTPFGIMEATSRDNGIFNPIRYVGRRIEDNVGLYDFRSREYLPALGRFLQRDPTGIIESTNLYNYAGANPLRYTDPSGNEREEIVDVRADEYSPIIDYSSGAVERVLYPPYGEGQPIRLRYDGDLPLIEQAPGEWVPYAKPEIIEVKDTMSESEFNYWSMQVEHPENKVHPTDPAMGNMLDSFVQETPSASGDLWLSFAGGLKPGLPRPVPSASTLAEARAIAVEVPGQVTQKAGKGLSHLFEQSRKIRREISRSHLESGEVVEMVGERMKVKVRKGEDVIGTTHTHAISQIARFSEDDIRAFATGRYPSTARHIVLGDRWPTARRVAAQFGIQLDQSVVSTTITQAQAVEAYRMISSAADQVLRDVTDVINGIARGDFRLR